MTSHQQTPLFKLPFTSSPSSPSLTFHSFTKLPFELRSIIWNLCLQRQRFITIKLSHRTTQNPPPRSCRHPPYLVTTQRRYRHSKFLRVNQEARRAALEFFRLRIPCCSDLDGDRVPLYFNPDYDVLYIHQERLPSLDLLIDFLPRIVGWEGSSSYHNDDGSRSSRKQRPTGLLHLALDSKLMYADNIDNIMDVETLAPAKEAFALALSRLESLWIVNLEKEDARIQWRGKVHHNRSVPVFPSAQLAFDQVLIEPFGVGPVADPRPIASDLARITTLLDPARELDVWRQLEASLGVVRRDDQPFELRVLVAVRGPEREGQRDMFSSPCPPRVGGLVVTRPNQSIVPEKKPIVDRATAQWYFAQQETASWDRVREAYRSRLVPPWGEHCSRTEWEDLQGRLRDAVGFWLFRPEAFEALPRYGHFGGMNKSRDLSKHPPELCVFDLGP